MRQGFLKAQKGWSFGVPILARTTQSALSKDLGFSLLECLVAMTITLGVGMSIFQLFKQNEHVFRDEQIVAEMQQSARVAAFQISDELRLAGQGTPVFGASFAPSPGESTVVILNGSSSSRINFRAGFSNVETDAATLLPVALVAASPKSLNVSDASVFADALGSNPSKRFVYLWGLIGADTWGWARATLVTISSAANSLQVIPSQTIQFTGEPTISLDEAVAIFFDGSANSIKRTAATDLTSPTAPVWAPANELAANITELSFAYYDEADTPIVPNTLSARSRVRRIEVNLTAQGAEVLSTGKRPSLSLSFNTVPRNLRIP